MINFIALLLVLITGFFIFTFRRFFFFPSRNTYLSYPSIEPLKKRRLTFLEKFSSFPKYLGIGALTAFAVAFMDPHRIEEDHSKAESPPTEGLAIYLLLDRSGSMQTVVDQEYKNGAWRKVTRFDVLKNATVQFIQGLPSDLMGVIAFARAAEVISPLTLDHKLLIDRVKKLEVIKDKEQDGTSMGYAIYKTAHLIAATEAFQQSLAKDEKPPYKIQKAIIIVVTDGFQDPSLLDKGNRLRSMELDVAAHFAKEKGIKVFILNVDSSIEQKQFLPNRNELENAAKETGGKLVVLRNVGELGTLLNQIPKEEKSEIYTDDHVSQQKRVSYAPYFIALGLCFLGLMVFFEETIGWRKL